MTKLPVNFVRENIVLHYFLLILSPQKGENMNIKALEKMALSIRALSMDAVQKANSGHPGMPMGIAELGALIYGEILMHNPKNAEWPNRDRFVLSAGHGSMLLYSLLHLSGYAVGLEDLKNFRQLESLTPGHPEYGHTEGVETTTGPLGQGIGNAVGMAIAEKMLAETFNTEKHKIVDHYTYALAGDGCMMEGIASESASIAGHLGLGKLIVFYDANRITIEGSTDLAFTEDVLKRFEAYGFQALSGDAYDINGMNDLIKQAKAETSRPSLILLKSIIGKFSPNLAGSEKTHGAALGEEECKLTKKALGITEDDMFYVDPEVAPYIEQKQSEWDQAYESWQELFKAWAEANPELKQKWDKFHAAEINIDLNSLGEFKVGDKLATRKASGAVLNVIAQQVENLCGGSADLGGSNNTVLKGMADFQKGCAEGRNMHFGVREHAMGSIANGMIVHGGIRPYCATFFVFADYMRPPMRLAALMKLPVIYVFTHDSIFVGEDGPTHQPIEHLASLRCIPNMRVIRPADAQETQVAWKMAMESRDMPTTLCFSRQSLEVFAKENSDWQNDMQENGAYIVKDSDGTPDVIIVATGSEVNVALKAANESGKNIRIISMPSLDLFLSCKKEIRDKLVTPGIRTITIEAGVSFGWNSIASSEDDIIAIDRFGTSANNSIIGDYLGISVKNLLEIINR